MPGKASPGRALRLLSSAHGAAATAAFLPSPAASTINHRARLSLQTPGELSTRKQKGGRGGSSPFAGKRWGGGKGCAGTRAGVPKCCGCGSEAGRVYAVVHGTSTDRCTSAAWCRHCQPPSPGFSRWILRAASECRVPGAGARVRYGTKTVTNRKITAAVSKKPFHRYEITSPAPRSPMAGSTKREKPQEEEAAWVQRHEGCAGQKHPSFPAAGQERTREGSCTLRACLRFLCQPHHKAACIQMCRQILAVPSPFWEGCDSPCPKGAGAGPSHPSRKATVSRPLHLGPICCC